MLGQTMAEGIGAALDPQRVLSRSIALSPQRDLMRQLFRTFGDDQEAVCLAYVEAERDGRIERPRGAENVAPAILAKALWWEGRLRGWLRF